MVLWIVSILRYTDVLHYKRWKEQEIGGRTRESSCRTAFSLTCFSWWTGRLAVNPDTSQTHCRPKIGKCTYRQTGDQSGYNSDRNGSANGRQVC